MWEPEVLERAPLPGTLVDNRSTQWIRGVSGHYEFPQRTLRPIEAPRTPSEANPFFRRPRTGQDSNGVTDRDPGNIRHLMATVENTLKDREVPRHVRQTVADLATLCHTLLYGAETSGISDQQNSMSPVMPSISARENRPTHTSRPINNSGQRRRSAAPSVSPASRRQTPSQSQLIQEMSDTITQKVLRNIRQELFNSPMERLRSPCDASQSSLGEVERPSQQYTRPISNRRQSKQLLSECPSQYRQGMWRPMPKSTFDDTASQDASIATVHQDSQDFNCTTENLSQEVRRLRMMLNKPHLNQPVKRSSAATNLLISKRKGCDQCLETVNGQSPMLTPGSNLTMPTARGGGSPYIVSQHHATHECQIASPVARGSMHSDHLAGSHDYDRNPETSSDERANALDMKYHQQLTPPQPPARIGSPQLPTETYPLNVVRSSSQPPVTARNSVLASSRLVDNSVRNTTPGATSITERELFPRENKSWAKNLQAEKEVFAAALKPPFKRDLPRQDSTPKEEVAERPKATKKTVIDRQILHTLRIDTLMSNGQGPKTREIDVVRVHCDPDLIVVPKLLTKAESNHVGRFASGDNMNTVQSYPALLSVLNGRNGSRAEDLEAVELVESSSTCVGRVMRRIAAVSQAGMECLEGLFLVKLGSSSFSDCTWRMKNPMSCILYIFLNELGNNGGEACALGLRVRSQLGTGLLWKDQTCAVSEKARAETKLILVAIFSADRC